MFLNFSLCGEPWSVEYLIDTMMTILQSRSDLHTAQHVINQRTYSKAKCDGLESNVPLSFHIKTYL